MEIVAIVSNHTGRDDQVQLESIVILWWQPMSNLSLYFQEIASQHLTKLTRKYDCMTPVACAACVSFSVIFARVYFTNNDKRGNELKVIRLKHESTE